MVMAIKTASQVRYNSSGADSRSINWHVYPCVTKLELERNGFVPVDRG